MDCSLDPSRYIASTSPYAQQPYFEKWAHRNRARFMAGLTPEEIAILIRTAEAELDAQTPANKQIRPIQTCQQTKNSKPPG
jgi:hypothetical protein